MASLVFQRGDFIIARFPYKHRPNVPGPKPRPCLTLGTDLPGTTAVVYSTDYEHTSNVGPDDLIVLDPDDLEDCSLKKPTRCCLNRVRNLPIQPNWMDVKRGVLGSLPDHMMKELRRRMLGMVRRGHTVQQAVPVLALLMDKPGHQLACGATLELRPHCATVQVEDFTAEFWFDDELTIGGDLLELTRTTPLLTAREKDMIYDVLAAKHGRDGPLTKRGGRSAA